jgi:Holliday junction resolvase RusA-like endonuclease
VPAEHPVHAYRQAIAEAADEAGLVAQDEPLNVVIDFVFERPKSHMTKGGVVVKATAPKLPRPDVDNLAKAVLDALQDVMGDDTNVARLVVEKSYGQEARTTVRIS